MTHDTESFQRAMLDKWPMICELCLFYFVMSGHDLVETVNQFAPGFDWQDNIFVIIEFVKIKLIIFGPTTLL